MPSKFYPPFGAKPSVESYIDLTKRYDVYRSEPGLARTIVHRNVLIRGVKILCDTGSPYGIGSQMLELQQPNGQTVYISWHHIAMLCEHGTDVSVEAFRSA
jgi:hypothetical protein